MLSFFKKKKDDEGVLSNLKTVTRWVQDLPAGDIYSAQEQVVKNLIQFNHAESNFSKDRLQVLMHLDESTQDMQSSLCTQYMRNARMSKTIESRLWVAIHAFYWEITRSYHGFLMDFVANPGGSKIQSFIPLITARAIRGFADIIKWRYFRYEPVDEKLWLRLHNLYRIAEFDNFSNTAVTVYSSDSYQRTPAHEYGQALLLSLFGNGSLIPKEIQLVDQWLDNWSDMIKIDTLYNPNVHTFYVDTSKGHGLRRCRNQISDPTLRFISTTDLLKHLNGVVDALKSGTPPASLGLSEEFRLPEGYSLISQVEKEWSPLEDRDRRSSPRVQKPGHWKVIHDLGNICNEFSKAEAQAQGSGTQLSPEEILDIKLYGFVTERTKDRQLTLQRDSASKPKNDLWEQTDISETGLGFIVSSHNSEWIKVGKLIALSPRDDNDWQLGVVTRLARQDEGARLIGIKLLSGEFQTVTLRMDGTDSAMSYIVDDPDQLTGGQNIKAILLTENEASERLLIDGSSYSRNRQYQIRSPFGPSRVIELESVENTGESWLKVSFKEIAV
ncbi:MAG: hypothetical protein P4L70_00335 [Parasulfuritortus sp.]|jgi:hypothetical protein|nr:hypothetical protein [Parasulfuritortus sp.]